MNDVPRKTPHLVAYMGAYITLPAAIFVTLSGLWPVAAVLVVVNGYFAWRIYGYRQDFDEARKDNRRILAEIELLKKAAATLHEGKARWATRVLQETEDCQYCGDRTRLAITEDYTGQETPFCNDDCYFNALERQDERRQSDFYGGS